MAFSSSSSSLCIPHFSLKIDHPSQAFRRPLCHNRFDSRSTFAPRRLSSLTAATAQGYEWSFVRGARVSIRPRLSKLIVDRKSARASASWLTNTQIASSVFTLGTVAVLPFYALMVVAPKSELTIKSMESSIPYVVLGIMYAYLLYLSWTPETMKLMFASKQWLPELPGIARMFSKEMTLASAWIHLLAVDLFAARQVFLDGLRNRIETRHSVCLCLMFCPIGVLIHFLTKTFIGSTRNL